MVDKSTPGSDNQLVSTICMFETLVAFGDTTNSTRESFCVNYSPNLADGAMFIVSNGTCLYDDIPSSWRHPVAEVQSTFDNVAASDQNGKILFQSLIQAFTDLYQIDLQLIVYDGNRYVLINKSTYEPDEQRCSGEKQAFIWCTNPTECWPLFDKGDAYVRCCVESFIDQVNEELRNSIRHTVEGHVNASTDDLDHTSVDDTSASTNQTHSSIVLASEMGMPADTMIEQFILQIYQYCKPLLPTLRNMILGREVLDYGVPDLNRLSPQDSAAFIHHRLLMISDIIQKAVEQTPPTIDAVISTELVGQRTPALAGTNVPDNLVQTEQNAASAWAPSTIHLSNTTPTSRNTTSEASATHPCDEPEIITQPHAEWHYRNMKEFEKKKLPFLPGEGPQRTPIRIKIGAQPSHPMYLAIQAQTLDHHQHPSKILVLKNTTVNMDGFCKDNNLSRLNFDECNQDDHWDPTTHTVYLLITPNDYKTNVMNVQIHMFNLYQTGSITKEKIDKEQLHLCKLAFWFCILEGETYKPISSTTFSKTIEEK